MKKKRWKPPKYKSVQDLVRWSSATGKTGQMKPGAPMDLYLERFEDDKSLRGDHRVTCCGCGFAHRFTFEVYTVPQTRGPDKGEPSWWMKMRAYGDEDTRPKKVIDAKGKVRK